MVRAGGPRRPGAAMADRADASGRPARLRRLVDDLAAQRIGNTFNQYRDTGGDDASADAPRLRRENLRRYLELRAHAPVVIVAEAGGWRGARYSGLTLCCERQFETAPTGGEETYTRTSRHPRGWSEPSATIVQRALASGSWQRQVLLWNTVPTHPAGPAAHSNRTPSRIEVEMGRALLDQLLEVINPVQLVALGRVAASALPAGVPVVRHPANGGASLCTAGIRRLLSAWLPEAAGRSPGSDRAGSVGAGGSVSSRDHRQRM
ncbi:MAG: uracil-DNA glycosylase [Candidatus Dormibacteria bacterium]